jgi:RNA polymerase sigma-70 factor (ECF subfamily)
MRDLVTETRIVEQLRRGDPAAIGALSDAYGSKILQLAFRYMKNREDAEEVTQDVLMKVFQKIDLFRGDAALSSWIYRITFNTAMSRLRSARTTRLAEVDVPVGTASDDAHPGRAIDPADPSSLADEQMLRRQLRERFAEAVDGLPSIYRTPVILRDLQGLSTEEASRRLRLKDQTLKSRLHRGRLMLRKSLDDFADGLTLRRPAAAF